MAVEMERLAKQQDGFIRIYSQRDEVEITVSYWRDLEFIKVWKENLSHLEAQKVGKGKWDESYSVRIAKVEREYFKQRLSRLAGQNISQKIDGCLCILAITCFG